ncbi:hypothetical protein M405DRAFT_66628 [Rhizopogon salebrosus TDB-379]|nr:hypothetical protein M405DRAFT_66628 [Rhizopogon salebrosus TDB-379]
MLANQVKRDKSLAGLKHAASAAHSIPSRVCLTVIRNLREVYITRHSTLHKRYSREFSPSHSASNLLLSLHNVTDLHSDHRLIIHLRYRRITYLQAARAFIIADSSKRRTPSRADTARALAKSEQFDLLVLGEGLTEAQHSWGGRYMTQANC